MFLVTPHRRILTSELQRLVLLFTLFTTGCASHPDLAAIPLSDTTHTIHYIYRDWHTSVMLDAATYRELSTLPQLDAALDEEVAPAGYVRIGWGDGDYYTGKSTSVVSATRALLASPYSAIQVIGYTANPFERIPAETRVELRITDAAMHELVSYLDSSFALKGGSSSEKELQPLQAYVENSGVFFVASQHYGFFHNCNTWSGEALRAAGLPIRSTLHLTAESVFEQALQISQYQQQRTASL
jgi:uncharacterized protein (TIGR02117 family)